jgi:heptosyltransferase III
MLLNKVDISPPLPRRLLIRPGAIGDFIVSLPALEHAATEVFTEVRTAEANLPLVRFADAKRSIISSGLDRLGLLSAPDVIACLRQFDSIVSWYGTNRPDFRQFVADAGLAFEFLPALPPEGTGVHAVDYYCAQVGAPLGAVPHIDVGEVERHDQVLFHPFASRQEKRWPYSFPVTQASACALRGPEEAFPGAIYIPDLFDLARFLAGARAYVGNDSGITHLAAAVGVPTIALFGPTDPAVWAPRGKHVRIIQAPTMAAIEPEAVIAALRDFGIY